MSASINPIRVHINCDMGEGIANEQALMPYITACNIACGGHIGDLQSMSDTVNLAIAHDVEIGAHPSYPDKENFGRKKLDISSADLHQNLLSQTQALKAITEGLGGTLNHFKPHGALYNEACRDLELAKVIIELIKSLGSDLVLFAPDQSVLASIAADNNITVMCEAFADRNYNDDLSLVSRDKANALIIDSELVFQHSLRLLNQNIKTVNNEILPLKVDTLCFHSDSQNAEILLSSFHEKCLQRGIKID